MTDERALSIKADLLSKVPQQEPFRFVDEIIEVDDERIVGCYTFRADSDFYRGHFPGNPVTPGVILIEMMAQISVVAFGIYLGSRDLQFDRDDLLTFNFLFTDCQAEFMRPVLPGERLVCKAERVFWRRMKLRSKAVLYNGNGQMVAEATLSGMGVRQ